ncbi:MAG: hypothetical protein AAGI91_10960 [Bacteroidota bacterium]
MRSLFLLLALVLGAGACSNPPRDEPPDDAAMEDEVPMEGTAEAMTGEPFAVEAGSTVRLTEEGVSVRFDEVVSDNRCPANVNCVQAGEAQVRFTLVDTGQGDIPFTLQIDGGITEVQDIERYQFERADRFVVALLLLQPYPGHGEDEMPMTATLEMRRLTR